MKRLSCDTEFHLLFWPLMLFMLTLFAYFRLLNAS